MSGIDEQKSLYIIMYEEWVEGHGDYVTSFRGIMARSYEEARYKAQRVINYYNQEYDTSDDGDNPDYKLNRVMSMSEATPLFLISDGSFQGMERALRGF